jgi:hypothetical protein
MQWCRDVTSQSSNPSVMRIDSSRKILVNLECKYLRLWNFQLELVCAVVNIIVYKREIL